ncbi:MAG TPA: NAAT family transporter [Thioalkalivibrio sp.]|nr:NAAT family transporter [Thioalkalivibrio sp.]
MDMLIANFILLFIVVDPIGVAAVFTGLSAGMARAAQRRAAVQGALVALGILLLFFLAGEQLLGWLGIGIPAFRVAGGILLFLLAIDMVLVRDSALRTATDSERDEAASRNDISVFPLAFPLLAGPGALTTVLLMASHGHSLGDHLAQAGVVVVVLLLALLALLAAPGLTRVLGATGVNVVNRVLGLILAALAAQYILDGLVAVFPGISGA